MQLGFRRFDSLFCVTIAPDSPLCRTVKRITAYISLDNVEVETILPTDSASKLKLGRGYGDFVVIEVIAVEDKKRHGKKIKR